MFVPDQEATKISPGHESFGFVDLIPYGQPNIPESSLQHGLFMVFLSP